MNLEQGLNDKYSWGQGQQGRGTQEGPPRTHNHSCQGAKGLLGCREGRAAFGWGVEMPGLAGRAGQG